MSPRKQGPDAWEVSIRPSGGRQFTQVIGRVWTQHSVPPDGCLTRFGAQQLLDGLLADADRGLFALTPSCGASFQDACDEWLRYVEYDRQRSPTTVRDYRSAVRARLVPFFESGTPIAAITAQHIDRFRINRASSGSSAATINKHLRILHGIFKRAIKVFGLATNPVAGVERQPHADHGDFPALDPEGVRALAGAAEDPQDAALYLTAALCGLRFGELRALTWADVDFGGALLRVRWNHPMTAPMPRRPKGKKVRSVPLVPEVAAALDALSQRPLWSGPDDLLFVNVVGRPIDASNVRKRYGQALSRAGLPRLRFHDLRHTFGTFGAQVWELPKLQAYMGHTHVETTMRYVRVVPKHDDAHRLSELFNAGLSPAERTLCASGV